MSVDEIVSALANENVDAWLFYDFRRSDPIGLKILGLESLNHCTRRWFYLVTRSGECKKLTHRIEAAALNQLPGESQVYASWSELRSCLKEMLGDISSVAMQYSPQGEIPYVSHVDAGTVELVKESGVDIVSSGNLIQRIEAVISDEEYQSHVYAAERVSQIVREAFEWTYQELNAHGVTDEFKVQTFILQRFSEEGLETYCPPIVAVGANSADPHYLPDHRKCDDIENGDMLLIDLWARKKGPGSIYYDITWVACMGSEVSREYQAVFDVVRTARDAALLKVQSIYDGSTVRGCDVDDAARNVIIEAGYGDFFIHRTGHSIHTATHGNGANLDNFETRDTRQLLPRTCFSIEPGIYLPGKFGIRSEINVFLHEDHAEVTGQGPQENILLMA